MVPKQIQRERVLAKTAAHVLQHGLSHASLRQLAAAAGVSDRMLLYYFDDKTELIAATLTRVALDMQVRLAEVFPSDARFRPGDITARAADLTSAPPLRAYMHLWVEITALAARGQAPYVVVAEEIAKGFHAWIDARLAIEDGEERRQVAAMLLVFIDGLSLLDTFAGGDIATDARQAMIRLLDAQHGKDIPDA